MKQQNKCDFCTNCAPAARLILASVCFFAIATIQTPAFASHASLAEAEASELAPGEYLWNPAIAPSGAMSMVIDLTSQRAAVFRNGTLIGISTLSSGKPGYETPDGIFTVLEKQRIHHSNKYDNAPMPYMQRLSWSGLALHAGRVRAHPSSHGCIRLPAGFAAALFEEKTNGMQVVITGHGPSKQEVLMASRQKVRRNLPADDLQAATFSSGEGNSNATPEPPCCTPPAAAAPASASVYPDRTVSGEADIKTNNANYGGVNRTPDRYDSGPYQDDERDNGYDRHESDRERPQEIPPPDLPPPPD
jgi:hypothetical protein